MPALWTLQFLFILTIVQFWWIAIWGIAYIVISHIAGKSKTLEFLIYAIMLLVTILILHKHPEMLERL